MQTISTSRIKKRPLSIYLLLGVIGFLAVIFGFSKTFFIPISKGSFDAPVVIHIHGAFAFAWVILYSVQTYLVHNRNLRMHKLLGWVGAFVALGVAVTIFPAGMFQVERDIRLGVGDTAYASIVGIVTSALMFAGLVTAAFLYRSKPDVHKAVMLLATIFVLWPAWFRFRHFFPSVPRADIWFGLILSESLIIIAWVVDYYQKRKMNKALLYVGAFIILETSFEVMMFDSPTWRLLSQRIYAMLSMLY